MDDLEISKKKFLYKSSYRGSKEMDLIIGNFAKKFIDLFDKNELHLFSQILDSEDNDLYQWIFGKSETPDHFKNRVFQLLIDFSVKQNDV